MAGFFQRILGLGNTVDTPPPPPAPPSRADAANAAQAQTDENRRRLLSGGRAGTILTGEDGVTYKTKLGA